MKGKGLLIGALLACAVAIGAWVFLYRDKRTEIAQRESPAVVSGISPRDWVAPPLVDKPNPGQLRRVQPPSDLSGKPIDLEDQSVKAYVDQRIAKARGGDPAASWEVYRAESICSQFQAKESSLSSPATGTPALNLKFLAEEVGSLKPLCDGVTPAMVAERLTFLATAANAGNADAQVVFYQEGPNGDMDLLQSEPNDPAVVQWKADSVRYLQASSNQGNPFALFLLAGVYQAGVLTPPDPQKSLTYWVASATLMGKDPAGIIALRDYAALTPAQKSTAVQQGVALARALKGWSMQGVLATVLLLLLCGAANAGGTRDLPQRPGRANRHESHRARASGNSHGPKKLDVLLD